MVTRGWGRGINWEIGIDIYTLRYIKQITNKDLLYSTGSSTQYSVMAYMGKESKKKKSGYMEKKNVVILWWKFKGFLKFNWSTKGKVWEQESSQEPNVPLLIDTGRTMNWGSRGQDLSPDSVTIWIRSRLHIASCNYGEPMFLHLWTSMLK